MQNTPLVDVDVDFLVPESDVPDGVKTGEVFVDAPIDDQEEQNARMIAQKRAELRKQYPTWAVV
ncbi:MAG: hypothetical protein PHO20_03805 [Candidatus Peribacteraceae bacterium]|nr:hypothetical protein [Candidatus Peribacteraceae bacterium]MDD5739866.1 hypothetical protein [Candidatus Peribacteraceae bacterium]